MAKHRRVSGDDPLIQEEASETPAYWSVDDSRWPAVRPDLPEHVADLLAPPIVVGVARVAATSRLTPPGAAPSRPTPPGVVPSRPTPPGAIPARRTPPTPATRTAAGALAHVGGRGPVGPAGSLAGANSGPTGAAASGPVGAANAGPVGAVTSGARSAANVGPAGAGPLGGRPVGGGPVGAGSAGRHRRAAERGR